MSIDQTLKAKTYDNQTLKKKQHSNKMRSHIYRQKQKLTKIYENNSNNFIQSSLVTNSQSEEVKSFLISELNVRCLLRAFMMGTGAQDIGRFMTIVGVGGGVRTTILLKPVGGMSYYIESL